jgi:hypothetical protein
VISNESEREKRMTAETNDPEIPNEKNDSGAPDVEEQQILNRIAHRFCRQAVETERRYDVDHDIFTK